MGAMDEFWLATTCVFDGDSQADSCVSKLNILFKFFIKLTFKNICRFIL